ncbi:MAG: adenosine kinase [Parabacteroides sp.]|uniref:Adenosine kinase n=1 Tax=Parabacteroides faecalis TaxID=2924040 RepID=A0ABT0C2H6_9BACT|nr:adenosine kinase [Parabacteroides faecalis]MCI7285088.1 adenosine kinase [Parabacteroides sp.]MDY6253485.1 adenosine kinase [Bacteroidales bacterium]MCJ2381210.1 adenosine kinase [Parabacteroides faecalis]MDD6950176.1 adenosine kinase [Parabacteroides sp.]MDD7562590.1 adenosine kinase [Parabacteroides sp.]
MKILGLGNALVDVLSKLDSDETLVKIGIQKGAMDMISREQMYVIRKYQANTETTQAPGGANCNTMRAIALLGGQSGFIGKVGDDNLGQFYEEALLKAGVASYLIKTEGPSGACTVFISPDGERTMGTFLGPAPTISPDEITEDVLSGYDCIHIEGYLIVNEELVRETMKKAKRLGLKVALDLANYNIVNAYKGLLEEVIPQYVDILFANASEAEAFTGLPAQEAVKALEKQVHVALVTLGKDGSLIGSEGKFYHVDAEGGKPVDTTGAGDNFAAGFLYGQSVGASLVQSAQIGSMLSGYVIDVVGPQVPADKWEQIKLKVKTILAGTKD